MSKPTKIDANTWHYRGFTIVRCTHSRTYIITEPERIDGSSRRLRDAKDQIDFIYYRRDQVAREVPVLLEADPDPDAVESVTLTVSLNQARTILAALSRRCDELEGLGGPQAEGLLAEAKATYQGVDQQVFVSPCP
jgi:hypothetical protein